MPQTFLHDFGKTGGHRSERLVQFTGPESYSTGGEALDLGAARLSSAEHVLVLNPSTNGFFVVHDDGNLKVLQTDGEGGALEEVADESDQSDVVVNAIVVGAP